ncbi:tRNA (5-methylaminomethyl-2-thiouridine)(34)-methyltransferase MnmD [uncultured Roseobacter sp.]|uniref:tRNA (5-methylaminomethyl-2-thiouridine)(34)-methyltransferase MnmD n=1 Tax=uncultured Roseobacter sp. TaxID=114847 RepID=UPI00263138AD|nr:tRNA (5-methylaminomethyl-2-thiouridine)(34)-methyltransferase MnmD [uncultured Roseobacter sp.]
MADLTWKTGDVPVSVRFDDPYFSLENGLAETRHVFLAGNDLPARFQPGFHIAELGFGTGLNFLTALLAWQEAGAPGPLFFTSFEAYPMSRDEMTRALAAFPELAQVSGCLTAQWQTSGCRAEVPPGVHLEVIIGDARATLPAWTGRADAWFLDGFSPARNPELWSADLMGEVAAHTDQGGTFATYTAAGFVRRALAEGGFDVTRSPGFGRKRHMSWGVLRP